MRKYIIKKGLVLGIILLFVGVSIVPGISIDIKKMSAGKDRDIIYVNWDGTGDYLTIQEGIDAANPGDTVFVYNGIYDETITIDKSINLIGENKDTTTINGQWGYTIRTLVEYVSINQFFITNSINNDGIWLSSNHNTISDNIISVPSQSGILLSDYNIVTNNIITQNAVGLHLWGSHHNNISGNTISNNQALGITSYHSNWNEIIGNTISNNGYEGLSLNGDNNEIIGNTISNNGYHGLDLNGDNNTISSNTISSNNNDGINFGSGNNNNNTIFNNSISLNNCGIFLKKCNNFIISGNTITFNSDYGLNLDYSCDNNIIYNNLFNNSKNARTGSHCNNNKWNMSKTYGTNIIGGEYLGGNFWPDYNGRDIDGDGLGDTKLPWDEHGQIQKDGDYHPLYNRTTPFQEITYVDDDYNVSTPGWGVDHFDSIQDGIDSVAISGAVYVYNGTYYETLVVDISVDLIGEDRNTTTIDGDGEYGVTVEIIADWVNISGFTSKHSTYGIKVASHHVVITGNTITNHDVGIRLNKSCSDVIVEGNAIVNNSFRMWGGTGIEVFGSDISIKGNLIGGHVPPGMILTAGWGIYIRIMSPEICNINVSWNAITDNLWGAQVFIYTTSNVTFYMNDIANNSYGGMEIIVEEPPNSATYNVVDGKAIIIKQNNFRKNRLNIHRGFIGFNNKIFWENNYWGRFRLMPKLIVVFRMITEDFGIPSRLELDWRPAKKPYDIPKIAI